MPIEYTVVDGKKRRKYPHISRVHNVNTIQDEDVALVQNEDGIDIWILHETGALGSLLNFYQVEEPWVQIIAGDKGNHTNIRFLNRQGAKHK